MEYLEVEKRRVPLLAELNAAAVRRLHHASGNSGPFSCHLVALGCCFLDPNSVCGANAIRGVVVLETGSLTSLSWWFILSSLTTRSKLS